MVKFMSLRDRNEGILRARRALGIGEEAEAIISSEVMLFGDDDDVHEVLSFSMDNSCCDRESDDNSEGSTKTWVTEVDSS